MKIKNGFFDKHHKLERFGVMFVALFLVMAVIISIAFVGKIKTDNQNMADTVIYTQKFSTSLSGVDGSVYNIYRSADKTKLFVVLNIKNISNISVNAKNYQMFLTGGKVSGDTIVGDYLEHEAVSGSIYMFGSTGYMGIYLVDSAGFPSQLYDLVIRCNSRLVSSSSSSNDKNASATDSFSTYDQFRIYFNPGGADCDVAEFLNKNDWTVVDAYEECVAREKEQELRDILSEDIKAMQLNLSAIDEYTERLVSLNVVIPDISPLIADDKIENTDDHLVFEPAYVLATGFDFDWYNGSIKSGYLDSLCGDMTYVQYLAKKKAETDGIRFSTPQTDTWVLSDGTAVRDLDTNITANKTITDTINLFNTALSSYYNNKQTYECKDLKSLLYLELDTYNVASDYTVNADKDSVLIVF